jgi:hypothetical protein
MSDAMADRVELWGRTEVQVRASDRYVCLHGIAWPTLRRVLADRHYEAHVRLFTSGQSPVFDLRDGRLWMPLKLAFHVVQQLDVQFALDVSRLIGEVIRGTPADDLPPGLMRVIKAALIEPPGEEA